MNFSAVRLLVNKTIGFCHASRALFSTADTVQSFLTVLKSRAITDRGLNGLPFLFLSMDTALSFDASQAM
jgi:hypothetical protein